MSEDLLFSAAFDDRTQQFFDNFSNNVRAMNAQMQGGMNQIQSGSEQSSVALGLVAGAVGGITAKLTEMALQAVKAFPALIAQSTQYAAAAQVTQTALIKISENAGITRDEILRVRDAMVAMTFSQDSANDALLRLVGSEIDLATATKLATAALNISAVIGQSEEEVLARLIQAGLTENQIVLRSLQLQNAMATSRAEQQRVADAQGVAITSLNRQQFNYNAIIKEAEKFTGAYASASEQAGTESGELREKIRDLQIAFGNTFLPTYLTYLQFMRDRVVELKQWFADNEETVRAWGGVLNEFLVILLENLSALIKIAGQAGSALGTFVKDVGEGIAGLVIGTGEASERMESLGQTAKQALVIIVAGFRTGIVLVTEFVSALIGAVSLSAKIMTDFKEWGPGFVGRQRAAYAEEIAAIKEQFAGIGTTAIEAGQETTLRLSEALGLIPPAAEEAGDGLKKTSDAADELAVALEDATAKIKKLNEAFAEEAAEVALKRARQEIDAAIQEARQREDIARNNQERIASIYAQAAKKRADILADGTQEERDLLEDQAGERQELEQNNAQKLLDIEIDYRRRLEDIQRGFIYDQQELARRNDAVGLLQLMRSTKRRLEDEQIARDRRLEDAATEKQTSLAELQEKHRQEREELRNDQAERLAEYDAWLQEQLAMAEAQRLKDIENLDRSLARQREDTARHRQWEDEDRARAHAKELAELGKHFAGVEGLTQAHLQSLLAQHGQAITGIDALWTAFYAAQQQRAATAATSRWYATPSTSDVQRADWTGGDIWETGGGHGISEWGFQRGGLGIFNRPTTVRVAEQGAEAFAAMPLGGSAGTLRHILSGSASLNVNGVSPELESQLKPMLYSALVDLVKNVRTT